MCERDGHAVDCWPMGPLRASTSVLLDAMLSWLPLRPHMEGS